MDYLSSVDSYTDFSGLDRLKLKGKEGEDGSIREVARQLESIFLNQLLKSMRQATEGFSEGSFLSSNQTKMYDQMLDSQLSVSLTKGAGIGLADTIVKQLSGAQDGSIEKGDKEPVQNTGADIRTLISDARRLSVSAKMANLEPVAKLAVQKTNDSDFPVTDILKVPTTPDEFIQWVYPHAVDAAKELGVSPKVLVAQSALETGWGQKPIVTAEGRNSHNLFGIKADSRWSGENTSITTLEYREGIANKERANFRVYDSVKESLQDYVQFLKTNPRYKQAIENSDDPEKFTQSLMEAGYATDPKYAEKIMGIFDGKLLNRIIGVMDR
ncbi:MAG: flagellar assembly peptidoglycan hydrolase FlgJ [Pseudomonadales bacterium]|nr:flagellar assembly peptidoglycan hydrolase FlgJ [Pseudomonadales bacterium]